MYHIFATEMYHTLPTEARKDHQDPGVTSGGKLPDTDDEN